jgi:hypothetical protein
MADCRAIADRLSARGLRHLVPGSLWPGSMSLFVRS